MQHSVDWTSGCSCSALPACGRPWAGWTSKSTCGAALDYGCAPAQDANEDKHLEAVIEGIKERQISI
eukprot:6921361-Alexandrium_andersonii.AAC.1